jgi:hypothetical protein
MERELSRADIHAILRDVDKDAGYEAAAVGPLRPDKRVHITMTVEQAAWLQEVLYVAAQRGVEPPLTQRLWKHINCKLGRMLPEEDES